MNWTKIPTNLIVEHTPDKDILAIVKYQLLWAALEHRPDDRTALRHMSANQLRIACQYIDSISANISLDINCCNNHRSRQKLYYAKIRGFEQKTDGHNDGHTDGHNDAHTDGHADGIDKIRLDKIRKEKEISNDISKKKLIDFDTPFQAGGQLWKLPPQFRKLALTKYTEEEVREFEKTHSCHEEPFTLCLNDIKHKPKTTRFVKPTLEEVKAYCEERNNGVDPNDFVNHYDSKGWMIGKSPMKDWKAAVRTWESRNRKPTGSTNVNFAELVMLWNAMAERLNLDKVDESDLMPEKKAEIEKIIAIKKPKDLKTMFAQLEKIISDSPKLRGWHDILGADGHWITKQLNWKANFAFCFSTKGWCDIMGGKYNGDVE